MYELLVEKGFKFLLTLNRIRIFLFVFLGCEFIGGLHLEYDLIVYITYIDVLLLCRFYVEDYRLLTDHITVEQYYFQAKQGICNVSIPWYLSMCIHT